MSEDLNEVETNNIPDELTTLKARADMLGIKYHPSIGVDKLKAKLNEKLGEPEEQEESKGTANVYNGIKYDYITHAQYIKRKKVQAKKDSNRLVRVIVTCMNPNKKDWEGEVISVGSAKLGTFKKYVPFSNPEGWHIPYIIYEAMKERKCSIFVTVKDHLGNKLRKAKQINEFNIEVLDPLSKEELKALAQRQAMAGSNLPGV